MKKIKALSVIPQETVERILAFYHLHSVAETRAEFGLTWPQVRSVTSGLRRPRGHRPPQTEDAATPIMDMLRSRREDVLAYHKFPHSAQETAAHFGVGVMTIRRFLKGEGIVRSTAPLGIRPDVINEIVGRRRIGETLESIGKAFGFSARSVYRILRTNSPGDLPEPRRRGKHWSWKGGRRISSEGYAFILIPHDHPFYNAMKAQAGSHYVLEHRLVMAEYLGRPLEEFETVHHINGNKSDNPIENLELRVGAHGPGVVLVCRACGSHDIIHSKLAADPRVVPAAPSDQGDKCATQNEGADTQ